MKNNLARIRSIPIAAVALLIVVAMANAQQANTAEWLTALGSSDLSEIARNSASRSRLWPHIPYLSQKDPDRDQRGRLARQLILSLKSQEINPPVDLSSLRQRTATFAWWVETLRTSGGYGNLLLSDTFLRAAVVHIAGYLVQNQTASPEVLSLVEKLPKPVFQVDLISAMLDDELNMASSKSKLIGLPEFKLLNACLGLAGSNQDQMIYDLATHGTSTNRLLNEKSISGLLFRLVETGLVQESALPGLAVFLQRGGRLEYLRNSADVTAFDNVMGPALSVYAYGLMGNGVADPRHLLIVFDELGLKGSKSRFYRDAID